MPNYPIFGMPPDLPAPFLPHPITPVPLTLYCVACDCSLRALPGAECWLCGGETTHVKPIPPWPPSITGPAMYAPTEPEENAA